LIQAATVFPKLAQLFAIANQNSKVATKSTHLPGTLKASTSNGCPNPYCTAGL
jgi:hypothetical protein